MRKLVLILLAFIAVVTFIRAFDRTPGDYTGEGSPPVIKRSYDMESN
jgi:hypothetical protein